MLACIRIRQYETRCLVCHKGDSGLAENVPGRCCWYETCLTRYRDPAGFVSMLTTSIAAFSSCSVNACTISRYHRCKVSQDINPFGRTCARGNSINRRFNRASNLLAAIILATAEYPVANTATAVAPSFIRPILSTLLDKALASGRRV